MNDPEAPKSGDRTTACVFNKVSQSGVHRVMFLEDASNREALSGIACRNRYFCRIFGFVKLDVSS